jgi:hypothetical protein
MRSRLAIVIGVLATAIAFASEGTVQTLDTGNTARVVAGDEGPSVVRPTAPVPARATDRAS